jgi:hypothetical protein
LIGIGVSNLLPIRQSRPRQLTLFADGSPVERTWEELEAAMDLIKERFGADAIKRGLLYPEE